MFYLNGLGIGIVVLIGVDKTNNFEFIDEISNRPLLLDRILVSPSMVSQVSDSGILHSEFEAGIDSSAQGRQKDLSEHLPVFLRLN